MLKIDVWVTAKHKSFYHGLNQNFDGTILGLQRERERERERETETETEEGRKHSSCLILTIIFQLI